MPPLRGFAAQDGEFTLEVRRIVSALLRLVVDPERGRRVRRRIEERVQQPLAVLGVGSQNPLEPSLRKQDDLLELLGGEPQQPFDLDVDIVDSLRHRAPSVAFEPFEHDGCGNLRGACPAPLGPLMLRHTVHTPTGALGSELQLDPRRRISRRMVGAEAVTPPFAWHDAVERKAERVEKERLTGTSGAVDQEDPLAGEIVEVDLDLTRVGAHGAEPETVRPHPPLSLPAAANASPMTPACASDGLAPC